VDRKVALLKEFSRGLVEGTVKIETEQYGFRFLDELLSEGGRLEYGELSATRLLHKYKLVDVPEHRMDALLRAHIGKTCNVCRYFHPASNDTFCFNLDNNHTTNNTVVLPEMTLAVQTLRDCLAGVGCEPLVVASGRGYHVWCRLDDAVDNGVLHGFMLHAAVRAVRALHEQGFDPNTVKFNFYPDVRTNNVVSLRLFGSEHAKTRVFSHVWVNGDLLGEAESWERFEHFLRNQSIPPSVFERAQNALGVGAIE